MLLELNVSQFAIINNVRVRFQPGLNILSGETGAGKSVLLKSLALLMGEKASAETVRAGAEHAKIEGLFDVSDRPDIIKRLQDQGIMVEEETLIVRRIVGVNGKNKIYINGSLTSLHVLQSIVAPLIEVTGQAVPLIEMTGQHDNRHLLSKSYHLDILDIFSGTSGPRESFTKNYVHLQKILEQIREIEEEARVREQRIDFLRFQRDEIQALGLKSGEDQTLQARYERAKNSSRLRAWADQSEAALLGDDESAIVRLHRVIQKASDLKKFDPQIEERIKLLLEAKGQIEEFVYDLRTYTSDLEDGPESMDSMESKISELRKLQKKYGESVEQILGTLAIIEKELSELENSDLRLEKLRLEETALSTQLQKEADTLHTKRKKGAALLSEAVNSELKDLNMKGVLFNVNVMRLEHLNSSGATEAEFMIRHSAKDPERSIAKVASGGELSRILLALKNVVGVGEFPRSYLFDEVDTGVSGPTAEKVGRKLKAIAKGQQVICVTHLPQVASFADHHYLIQKTQSKTGVGMEILELKEADKVQEIARLISGEKITRSSLEHARELLSH